MQKRKTITRETAVKKDKAGKIGQEPKFVKDKVSDDIRESIKTQKIDINLQSPVASGIAKLADAIKQQASLNSPLMKSLQAIEKGAVKVEQVRRPATKIAKKAISDIAKLPDVEASISAARKALVAAKKEISATVKSHLDEIEKKIRQENVKSQEFDFEDIKNRIRKYLDLK